MHTSASTVFSRLALTTEQGQDRYCAGLRYIWTKNSFAPLRRSILYKGVALGSTTEVFEASMSAVVEEGRMSLIIWTSPECFFFRF